MEKTFAEATKDYEAKFKKFQKLFEKLFGFEGGNYRVVDVSEDDLKQLDRLESELAETHRLWFKIASKK